MNELVVAKGKKIVRFDLLKGRPTDDELLSHMLGRSGTLRAPSLRVGKTFVVGYNAEMLETVLG